MWGLRFIADEAHLYFGDAVARSARRHGDDGFDGSASACERLDIGRSRRVSWSRKQRAIRRAISIVVVADGSARCALDHVEPRRCRRHFGRGRARWLDSWRSREGQGRGDALRHTPLNCTRGHADRSERRGRCGIKLTTSLQYRSLQHRYHPRRARRDWRPSNSRIQRSGKGRAQWPVLASPWSSRAK